MRLSRILGILLIAALLIGCSLLFLMRGDMTKVSDKAALEAALATPTPGPTPEGGAPTPPPEATPTPEPTATPEPTPTEEPTPDPDSPAGRAAALGLPRPPEIDIESWEFTLVNGDHSIGQYVPEQLAYLDMTVSQTDIQLNYNAYRQAVDARIAQPLLDMALACKQAGLPVYLSSGYRSYAEQAANFQRICQNNGVTDGKDANGHYITMPAGCSEHQLALCCDITDVRHEIKNDAIAQIPTVQWLNEHCSEFGFILRFPADKRDITKVMSESWHFRYVGQEAAKYIMENNLCLEEFIALYKDI